MPALSGAVAVLGSLAHDTIVDGGVPVERLGGVVTYAGLTYLRHGLRTRLCFNLSRSDFDRLQPLTAAGAELRIGSSPRTTCCENHVDGDQRSQRMPSIARSIDAAEVEAATRGDVGLVHLGPLHPHDLDDSVLGALPMAMCVLDVQGMTRRIDGDAVEPCVAPALELYLGCAQIVKGDEQEIELIREQFGLDHHGILQAFKVRELIETRGSRGGSIFVRDGRKISYAAVPASRAGDATGAGDVFLAAYAWARGFEQMSVENAAEYAADLASQQVSGDYLCDLSWAAQGG